MQSTDHTKLTSGEIAVLWTTCINDSLAICVLRYFLEKTQDPDIRSAIIYAIDLANKHIQTISEACKEEDYPIPKGFANEDVDITAPALFDDNFYLYYLHNMSRIALASYGIALSLMTRQDMYTFMSDCLSTSIELTKKATTLLLSKNLVVKPPIITISDKIDFVKKQSFLTGYLGERRNLMAIEIAILFTNIQANILFKTLLSGFANVAKSEEIKNLMLRGINIADKHIEIFSSKLEEDDIPVSTTWNTVISDSTVSTFSDKLMLFHVRVLISSAFGNYGTTIATSMRHDLQVEFVRLSAEIGIYGEDCTKLMIDNEWLEQPPQAIDPEILTT
jgi:hypothetical protein